MELAYDKTTMDIKYCNDFFSRFKGFMFVKNINYGLCFPKCNSIHTFFMIKPIDIIMTDKNYNILYIYKNFKPWKIILPKKKVYHTFEFPVNKFDFKINDKLTIN